MKYGPSVRFASIREPAPSRADREDIVKPMNETPVFKDYAARITSRPACKRMMEKDGA